jgi:hypothetical protein
VTRFQPGLEFLENRSVPSVASLTLREVEPNDTLAAGQPLGTVDVVQSVQVDGEIGNGAAQAADVDWYHFHADQVEKLTLTLVGGGIVTLYQTDAEAVPLGHRQLVQFSSLAGQSASSSLNVLPGDYDVAVSGLGNRYFSPILANSGSLGREGPYQLMVSATESDFDASVPVPIVRTDIPVHGYLASPVTINVYLAQPLDLTQDYVTILDAGQNDLSPGVAFNQDTSDLVITPASALDIGRYQIVAWDANDDQILAVPFSVIGRKGIGSAPTNDTLASATPLNDITRAGLVQRAGVIGEDPYYSPFNSLPTATNPSSQVDMYGFTINGPGRYQLTAEAFAGRIASPLDAALTLFQITGTHFDGTPIYQLVAGDDNSFNTIHGTDGELPLYTDPVLFAGLSAGRYVIAVSATGNYGDPLLGIAPGVNGRFDPNQSHSGSVGWTTGSYVLNLLVQPGSRAAPTVTAVSVSPGQVLTGAPTQFSVQFSAAMNLVQMAAYSGQQWRLSTFSGNVDPSQLDRFSIFVLDQSGQRHFVALDGYDVSTGLATFTLLERLTDGVYTLHLSGAGGLTDLAGDPLAGNSSGGDYVVPFSIINSPPRPAPLLLANPDDSLANPTELGLLYASELTNGVVVARDFRSANPAPVDQADYYRFTVLDDASVTVSLGGTDLNVPGRPVLLDGQGNPMYPAVDPHNPTSHAETLLLHPGTYVLEVSGWMPRTAAQAVYTLRIVRAGFPENPTPLTTGPAPAYRLRFDSLAPPTAPIAPTATPAGTLQLNLPVGPVPTITLTVERNLQGSVPAASNPLAGTATGLASGPVGVVANPTTTIVSDTIRLVLPLSEPPTMSPVTIGLPDAVSSMLSGHAGMMVNALESTLRLLFLHSFDWLRMPPLSPRLLLGQGDETPATDHEPEASSQDLPQDSVPESDNALSAGLTLALACLGESTLPPGERERRKAHTNLPRSRPLSRGS